MERKNFQRNNKRFSTDRLLFFIEAVAKFCDKCGTPYTTNDLQIIQESESSSIIHFFCPNCKSQHMATFIRPVGISSRSPINTDLAITEISEFAKTEKVPVDDILEVYTLLGSRSAVKI